MVWFSLLLAGSLASMCLGDLQHKQRIHAPVYPHSDQGKTTVNVYGGSMPKGELAPEHAKSMERIGDVVSESIEGAEHAASHAENLNEEMAEENQNAATAETLHVSGKMEHKAKSSENAAEEETQALGGEEDRHEKVIGSIEAQEKNDRLKFQTEGSKLRAEAHELESDMRHKEGMLREDEEVLQETLDDNARRVEDAESEINREVGDVKRIQNLRGAEEHEEQKLETHKGKTKGSASPRPEHRNKKEGSVTVAVVPVAVGAGGSPCSSVDKCGTTA